MTSRYRSIWRLPNVAVQVTLGLYRNRSTGRSPNETHRFRGAVRIEP